MWRSRPTGQVKVLDFGLAKASDQGPGSGLLSAVELTQSPTIASPGMMSGVGIILGTAAYMAPEQARGQAADKRADIWAFGCLFFEMLTGRDTFTGQTVTDIVAAVMKSEPDWSRLPSDTPPLIRSLLRRCLQKDPTRRLRDAGDAAIEIQETMAEPGLGSYAVEGTRKKAPWVVALPWVLTALSLAAALLATQGGLRLAVAPSQPVTRLELNLPDGVESNTGTSQSVAVSPDGTRVVFVGMLGGLRRLYLRNLNQSEAVPLPGTETAQSCFFSPDGETVGFITGDRNLKRMSIADGLVVTLALGVDPNAGASWGPDDQVTFSQRGTLWQMPGSGGQAKQLTTLEGGKREIAHVWPTVIDEGRAILFASVTGSRRDSANIEALSLATGQRHVVLESGSFPMYAASGHLIFFRDRALLAAPFDAVRLEVTGQPVRMVENLAVDFTGAPLVTVSTTGSLVYPQSGAETSRLVWLSRQGVEQPITDTARPYMMPRLAPDGRRIVVQVAGDLWLHDTARATFTRLTSEETTGNSFPVWTPDGKRVVFRTATGMHWTDTDGSGQFQAIPGSTSVADIPSAVSPDGQTLAFIRQESATSGDVYVLSLRGESKPRPVVATPGYDGGAQFSPDGRWMAYVSNESGQFHVYVRPFPGPDRKWQVSTQGGTHPHWNKNGKELFYRSGNKMMVVDVSTSPDIALSSPRLLFEQRYAFGSAQSIPNYDVSLDGQRFVMVKDESGSGRLNIVLNWFEELKARVPTK